MKKYLCLFIAATVLLGACDVLRPGGDCLAEANRRYSDEDIDYFIEIALGSEFGEAPDVVRKWSNRGAVNYYGQVTADDQESLNKVVFDLTSLGGWRVDAGIPENENIAVYFVTPDDFAFIEPSYEYGQDGFTVLSWNDKGRIYKARIFINEDAPLPRRQHAIREQFARSMGLMNTSERYPQSIFHQGASEQTDYADIDRMLIEMINQRTVSAGMSAKEVRNVLCTIKTAPPALPLGPHTAP